MLSKEEIKKKRENLEFTLDEYKSKNTIKWKKNIKFVKKKLIRKN
jgi:hypothetical protein